MAKSYDAVHTSILDRLVPLLRIVHRPRPSDTWFDGECRDAKRHTRHLECVYSAASRRQTCSGSAAAAAMATADTAKSVWYDQRREYRELQNAKRSVFWCEMTETDQSSLRRIWRSVDTLLGCGRLPASSAITVDEFNNFFVNKVAVIKSVLLAHLILHSLQPDKV